MKRIIFLFFAVVICFAAASCASESDSEGGLPEWTSTEGNLTFDGMTFYFVGDIASNSETFLSYYKNTAFGDMAMQRFADVEEEFDCEIVKSTQINSVEQIFVHAAVQSPKMDVFIEHIFYGGNEFKRSGVLLPFSLISDIVDYYDAEKWGPPNLLEEFVYEDEIYGVLPIAWPDNNFMSLDFFLVINSEMTAQLGLTDPREYLETGTWTRDQFEQMMRDYTFTDNYGNHVYAAGFGYRHLVDLAFKSFGVPLAVKNSDGTYTSGYFTPEGAAALQWAGRFHSEEFAENVIIEEVFDQDDDWVNRKIAISLLTANYAFSTSSSGDSSSIVSYSGIPFALLPFPSGDGKEIISQHERTINAIMMPSWCENYREAAYVLNAIFEPFEGFETLDDMLDYYTNNLFFDRRDAELVFKMQKTSRYLFHDEGIQSINRVILAALSSMTAAASIESYEEVIQTFITEQVAPVKRGMEALFGMD